MASSKVILVPEEREMDAVRCMITVAGEETPRCGLILFPGDSSDDPSDESSDSSDDPSDESSGESSGECQLRFLTVVDGRFKQVDGGDIIGLDFSVANTD